jgi:Ca2+-binding RTX toxin-like protein
MSTVTISGANGQTVSLNLSGSSTGQATTLLQQFSTALSSNSNLSSQTYTPGSTLPALTGSQVGLLNISSSTTPSGPVTLPSSYGYVLDQSNSPLAITASGAASLVSEYGGLTFTGASNAMTNIVAAGGDNSITLPSNTSSTPFTAVLGTGNDSVYAAGNGTINVGGGTNVVSLGGAASTSSVLWAAGTGDALTLGAGAATVGETGSNGLAVAGAGAMVFADGGYGNTVNGALATSQTVLGGANGLYTLGASSTSTSVVVGNLGAETINAGSGSAVDFAQSATQTVNVQNASLEFIGGTGADTLMGGAGKATVIGASTGTVDFQGTSTGSGALLVASSGSTGTISDLGSSGNDSLFAGAGNGVVQAASTGNDTVFGGTGASTMVGGAGHDVYAFFKGVAGGSATIEGFKSTDSVLLSGYGSTAAATAFAGETVSGGSTIVTLADNTKITFLGNNSLTSANFYSGS